jgi:hypothetical protein
VRAPSGGACGGRNKAPLPKEQSDTIGKIVRRVLLAASLRINLRNDLVGIAVKQQHMKRLRDDVRDEQHSCKQQSNRRRIGGTYTGRNGNSIMGSAALGRTTTPKSSFGLAGPTQTLAPSGAMPSIGTSKTAREMPGGPMHGRAMHGQSHAGRCHRSAAGAPRSPLIAPPPSVGTCRSTDSRRTTLQSTGSRALRASQIATRSREIAEQHSNTFV